MTFVALFRYYFICCIIIYIIHMVFVALQFVACNVCRYMFVVYDVCRLIRFVVFKVCHLIMFVTYCMLFVVIQYDVCRLIMFFAYDVYVCHFMMFVALWRLSHIRFLGASLIMFVAVTMTLWRHNPAVSLTLWSLYNFLIYLLLILKRRKFLFINNLKQINKFNIYCCQCLQTAGQRQSIFTVALAVCLQILF